MFFYPFFNAQLSIHSFLVGDEASKKCVIIDPTRLIYPYIIQAQNNGFEITDILETHVHADFISGALELKHELNQKPQIWSSVIGGLEWLPKYSDIQVKEGTVLDLGSICFKAIHTPGHTFEHVSWACYDEKLSKDVPCMIFTGDSLLIGGAGRPDLIDAGSTRLLSEYMYATLFQTFEQFPDLVEIYPSHGAGSACGKSGDNRSSSTLGYERLFNPCFEKKEKQAWMDAFIKSFSPPPPYFQNVKKTNLGIPTLLQDLKSQEWQQNSIALSELFLIDVRQPEIFAESFIKNSVNILFNASFCKWAGWIIPQNQPLGIIAESSNAICQVSEQMRVMGFDQAIWKINLSSQLTLLQDHFNLFEATSENYHSLLNKCYILDVRTPEEWNSDRIEGAHHLELNQLIQSNPNLSIETPIAVICKSGARASLAASLLKKRGYSNVVNVKGGMDAWKRAQLPIS